MGIVVILREGTWWVRSKKDHRWNASGRAPVGGCVDGEECKEEIERLKQELGDQPDDLQSGYNKH